MITYLSSEATISRDELYRYRLIRTWGTSPLRVATFIMFNPSTADATEDDRTIRRCVGYAQRWQCDAVTVLNLFAFRSKDPKELMFAKDPVGPLNDSYLRLAISMAAHCRWPLVVAWGALAENMAMGKERVEWVRRELDYQQATAQCLKVTGSGAPVHPLYQPADARLLPWPPA